MKFVLATFAAVAIKAVAGTCTDSNTYCAAWAAQGECTNNAAYMLPNCKLSCNACNPTPPAPTCLDSQNDCPTWANSGWCTRDSTYMLSSCKKSCNACDGPAPSGDKVKVSLYYEA